MKESKSLQLESLAYKINAGDIQVAYNTNLNIQVLIMAVDNKNLTENDYHVFFIKKDIVIKKSIIGLTSKIGYYSARDIASQWPHLPIELKIIK
jgi:hypothetical protein